MRNIYCDMTQITIFLHNVISGTLCFSQTRIRGGPQGELQPFYHFPSSCNNETSNYSRERS